MNKQTVRKVAVLVLICLVGFCVTGFSKVTPAKDQHSNPLITYYEMINENMKLEKAIQSSLKEVFKKNGYPDGRELTISRDQKEIRFVYRPYAKSDLNYIDELKRHIKQVLKSNNYKGYDVKVLAYANDTNVTERLKREEKMIAEAAKQMGEIYGIDVSPGMSFSSTDGHVQTLQLFFYQNHKKITDPHKINRYHKEFIARVQKKGFDIQDIPTYFTDGVRREWEMKIIPALSQGLKEIDGLKVASTTIMGPDDPIFINTSIKSTDPKAKETGERIEKLVKGFLQYDKVSQSFPGTQKIYVQSEDGRTIN